MSGTSSKPVALVTGASAGIGAVYAERFIAWAAQLHLCADPANTLLSKPECDLPGDVLAADAMHNQKLYDQLVNAFSTRSLRCHARQGSG